MSVFDKYGGDRYWGPVFVSILDMLRQDEQLAQFFTDKDTTAKSKAFLVIFQQALGFEPGHFPTSIHRTHAHLNVQESDFNRFLAIFEEVIKRNGVTEEDVGEVIDVCKAFQRDIVRKT